MQRTSGDLAKFVGLALFTLSKPEFTPFLCSFFPQVVPSTYLSPDEKLQRAELPARAGERAQALKKKKKKKKETRNWI